MAVMEPTQAVGAFDLTCDGQVWSRLIPFCTHQMTAIAMTVTGNSPSNDLLMKYWPGCNDKFGLTAMIY
jgi:hypothetical protein